MKCIDCNTEIPLDADKFCPHCGAPFSVETQKMPAGQYSITGHTSILATSKIGTSFVYPQAGNVTTVDQMENAYLELKNLKLRDYPICKGSHVAIEVYCNRIFAFKYQRHYINMGGQKGGAISSLGILKIWKDRKQFYPWEDITSMKVKETTYQKENRTEVVYTVDMTLKDGSNLGFDTTIIFMAEFSNTKKIKAQIFAYYYNRMRQERMQNAVEQGGKKIILHGPLGPKYAGAIQKRFLSPEGLVLKQGKRKTHILKPSGYIEIKEGLLKFKGKRKVKTEEYLRWEGITDIHLAMGLKNQLLTIIYWGTDRYKTVYSGGDPQPPLEITEKPIRAQARYIIALCWLAL